uniref:Beta-lactamase n=1 Tax=Magnetococcus massalia (strain MO-1) TaxID=451514 RepID=A0A1S7LI16_MAGMO|nr:Conserved protein of unknown function. Sel1 domain repeat-containing protein [Candidatus Magnetococcus massalia]
MNAVNAEGVVEKGDALIVKPASKGRIAQAQKSYERALSTGEDGAALIRLGRMAWRGVGQPSSMPEAVKYWERAYRAGRVDAAYLLGQLYDSAVGKQRDAQKLAIRWYRLAADGGHGLSMYRLWQKAQDQGDGLNRSAMQLLIRSGEHGEPFALLRLAALAEMAHDGRVGGRTQVEWLTAAATLGDPLARMRLVEHVLVAGVGHSNQAPLLMQWAEEAAQLGEWGAYRLHQQAQAQWNGGGKPSVSSAPNPIQQPLQPHAAKPTAKVAAAPERATSKPSASPKPAQRVKERVTPQPKPAGKVLTRAAGSARSQTQAVETAKRAAESAPAAKETKATVRVAKLHPKAVVEPARRAKRTEKAAASPKKLSQPAAIDETRKVPTPTRVIEQAATAKERGSTAAQSRKGASPPRLADDEGANAQTKQEGSAADYGDLPWADVMRKARRGDVEAQYHLGLLMRDQSKGPDSLEQARKWLTKAAEKDHVQAQNSLGYLYSQGMGDQADYRQALKWYGRAAKSGDALAQFNMGHMHLRGKGVSANPPEAFQWYLKSARQGFAPAQTAVGFMFENGIGTTRRPERGLEWYGKAAQKGYGAAHNALGRYLFDDAEPKQELQERGIMHFRLGDWAGNATAKANYEAAVRKRSPESIARIDALAKGWLRAHPKR